jgi:hypothetical protein
MEIGPLTQTFSASYALRAMPEKKGFDRYQARDAAHGRPGVAVNSPGDAAQRAQAADQVDEGSAQFRFKQVDGTQVLEVLSRKDVLIYQMPAKGVLALIRAQDMLDPAQLATSA